MQSSWLESAVCMFFPIFMCGMMNDSERCVNSFQGYLQLPLHSLRIWKSFFSRPEYALFFDSLQCVDGQYVMWFPTKHDAKLHWKMVWFVLNYLVIPFILVRNLTQIALWFASNYMAFRLKLRAKKNGIAKSNLFFRRLFSIRWGFEVLNFD